MGAGEGIDNLDFLADLSALKVIDPDSISKALPPGDVPVPNSPSILLEQLMQESTPYSHCAWCLETPKTRSMPSCGVATILFRSTISVPDYHGNGVAAKASKLWVILPRSCASKRSDAVR